MLLYITNLSTNGISVTGDEGIPNLTVPKTVGAAYTTVDAAQLLANDLLCTSLVSLIDDGDIRINRGSTSGGLVTSADVDSYKAGTFNDTDEDGTVDKPGIWIRSIDVKDAATVTSVQLTGISTSRFIPRSYYFIIRAAAALNADGTVNIGTASGGTQLLAAQALTNLNTVNEVFRVDVAVTAAASIAGNATLYFEMAGADTGTSGTMDVFIEGTFL